MNSRMKPEGLLKRPVNLRRNRKTTITGLKPDDRVTAAFDERIWEWRLLIESSNGVQIGHQRLTPPPAPS